jgi:DNA invertase Pin-like site-specific DNA recombinase
MDIQRTDELQGVVCCRLPRSPETDEDIEQQRARGCAVVAERGWTLVRHGGLNAFIDDGKNANKKDVSRPAWTALLERSLAGEVDVIVAHDSDRLCRNWDDFARLVRSSSARQLFGSTSCSPASSKEGATGERAE